MGLALSELNLIKIKDVFYVYISEKHKKKERIQIRDDVMSKTRKKQEINFLIFLDTLCFLSY